MLLTRNAAKSVSTCLKASRPCPWRLGSEGVVIGFVHVRHNRVLRIVWLGGGQERLEREHRRLDAQRGRPLIFEDVEADGAVCAADVGMPHLGDEAHLGSLERVGVGELDVHLRDEARRFGAFGQRRESRRGAEGRGGAG